MTTAKNMRIIATLLLSALLFAAGAFSVFAAAGDPQAITRPAAKITHHSATLQGLAIPGTPGEADVWFEYGTDSDLSTRTGTSRETIRHGTFFSAPVSGLNRNMRYYFRLVVRDSEKGTLRGNIESFKTASEGESGVIAVHTLGPLNVGFTTAILRGAVDAPGVAGIRRWFEWGEGTSLGVDTPKTVHIQDQDDEYDGEFSHSLVDLEPNAAYSYRAVAEDSSGKRYLGDLEAFSTFGPGDGTAPPPPFVLDTVTLAAGTTTKTEMLLYGHARTRGGIPTNGWFEWGLTPDLGRRTPVKSIGAGELILFEHSIRNLAPGTVYFYRAAAQNEEGISRGEILAEQTLGAPATPPPSLEKNGRAQLPAAGFQEPKAAPPVSPDQQQKEEKKRETECLPCPSELEDTGKVSWAAAVYGTGFFPDTLIGWLIAVLLVITLVILAHKYRAARRKQKEEKKRQQEQGQEQKELPQSSDIPKGPEFRLPGQE